MISIKKDKTELVYTLITNDDWYAIDNEELERKIMLGFPDIDFILDDDGEVIDVIYTKPLPPTIEEQIASLQEENQMLVDCILEMSEIIYGGE